PFLTDWRGRYRGDARCVVLPGSSQQVVQVVRLCALHRVPMVPQGGNTSLCGAATPDGSGTAVVISLARLNRIRALDAANNTVTVDAGCLLAQVQEAARAADRLFPLALASQGSCQVGGNLSTNAGGVQVLRYGNTRELTLGLEVVLADGRLWDGLRGLRKDNTGYDLKQLFIGAEGTLGIITGAVLKLFPLPKASATAWLAVTDAEAAIALLMAAQERFGPRLTAFELVSQTALQLVLQHIPGSRGPLAQPFSWQVLLELNDGGTVKELTQSLEQFMATAMDGGLISDGVLAQNVTQARQLWSLRENISEAQKIEGISIKHDVAVPVSCIPEFLTRADAALAAAFPGVRVVAFGHAGDGNLHYNLSKPDSRDNSEFIAATPMVNQLVHDLVHDLGGSISAEHGIGQLKRDELCRYKSELERELMGRVKASLDPLGLMNPGKIL
ncbi:MAG: FAD-binding oxidoreductase, partial [Betaproteobacteria bacterium]|nr:FAD-binding oxidoreductase [Betaproteobacteria bacterium]